MTVTTRDARDAIYRLSRLDRCDGIKPQRAGDELVCANDQVELVGSPLRHSTEEIRRLREAVGPGWPK
jgi:hypothetical protein